MLSSDAEFIALAKAIVGEEHVSASGDGFERSAVDYLGRVRSTPLALISPADARQVSDLVLLCGRHGVRLTAQGGNTGLVGGSVPMPDGARDVIFTSRRMRKIREVNPRDNAVTVEAGATLAEIQAAAEAADRLFPLSLGSEGSCTIGGAIATNAGGHTVLRYGSARDLVLGIEAVTADGRIISRLRPIRKDNTGYDLRGLICGSEGTLAFVTAATLRLFPRHRSRYTALLGIPSLEHAVDFFEDSAAKLGEFLTTFELIPEVGYRLAAQNDPAVRLPGDDVAPYYILLELATGSPYLNLQDLADAHIDDAMQAGIVSSGAIAASEQQRSDFWRIRELMVEAQMRAGPTVKHDISVRISVIPQLISEASELISKLSPDLLIVPFGHIGDGNIHFNVTNLGGIGGDWSDRVSAVIYQVVNDLAGSISAEHGIGTFRREALLANRSDAEIELMQSLKAALDPQNLLNPGKIFVEQAGTC